MALDSIPPPHFILHQPAVDAFARHVFTQRDPLVEGDTRAEKLIDCSGFSHSKAL